MATAHRTPSMIALRARHQAYRIASDFLHPPLQVPAPPEPAMPIEPVPPPGSKRVLPFAQRVLAVIATLIWLLAGSIFFLTWYFNWKSQ